MNHLTLPSFSANGFLQGVVEIPAGTNTKYEYNKQLQQLMEDYQKRLSFYIKFELEILPDIKNAKNLSEAQQKEKEGELILSKIGAGEELILLDENGKSHTSVGFSEFLQKNVYRLEVQLFLKLVL
jgi:23S rRNA pseudoU1915 N3-methylase RlmH